MVAHNAIGQNSDTAELLVESHVAHKLFFFLGAAGEIPFLQFSPELDHPHRA
jgi:hypothetical protein